MSKTLPAHAEADLSAELVNLAQTQGRSRSAVMENALRSHVDSEGELLEKVNAGLSDVSSGRLTDHETVATSIRRIYRPVA